MGKALWYIELLFILFCQFDAEPFSISLAIASQVNRDIEYRTFYRPYQFPLGKLLLEVQPGRRTLSWRQDWLSWTKFMVSPAFFHVPLIIGLHKISSGIRKYGRFNHIESFNVTRRYFYLSHIFMLLTYNLSFLVL